MVSCSEIGLQQGVTATRFNSLTRAHASMVGAGRRQQNATIEKCPSRAWLGHFLEVNPAEGHRFVSKVVDFLIEWRPLLSF
jgi:hypothetical protein